MIIDYYPKSINLKSFLSIQQAQLIISYVVNHFLLQQPISLSFPHILVPLILTHSVLDLFLDIQIQMLHLLNSIIEPNISLHLLYILIIFILIASMGMGKVIKLSIELFYSYSIFIKFNQYRKRIFLNII